MKLEATPEGAAALREFAEAMPLAIENIRVSTEDLFGIVIPLVWVEEQ